MRTIRILVAVMAIALSTAAFNSASAQNVRRDSGSRHSSSYQHAPSGSRHAVPADNRGGGHAKPGSNKMAHNDHGGHGGHAAPAPTPHHNGGHGHAAPAPRHNGHAAPAPHHNYGHHAPAPHHFDSHNHYYDHRYHAYVHYNHDYYRHAYIHHMHYGYIPVAGHVVDFLPDEYVVLHVDGMRLYRALGHIFRPILIGETIRYLVE